jgi:hypothetical protein
MTMICESKLRVILTLILLLVVPSVGQNPKPAYLQGMQEVVKGASKLLRGFREISFSQQIWRGARAILSARSYDLIIFFSPTIFFAPLVQRLKKLYSCPAYLRRSPRGSLKLSLPPTNAATRA